MNLDYNWLIDFNEFGNNRIFNYLPTIQTCIQLYFYSLLVTTQTEKKKWA